MAALPEDELAPFVLPSVEGLRVGEKKGSGAYGTAHRVTVDGVPCIAKRIHEILQDEEIVTSEEKDAIQRTFRQECIILSRLRHSNIVRFVGVHYGRDNELSLVMECLYTDLGKCLDTHHANKSTIPLSVKIAILLDISSGLLYLHSLPPPSGPVIHRDLSAGNVLLTIDMRAKIADLGVSKLLSRRAQTTMKQTKGPGTIDYMPPEAMEEIPKYDTKLDVFSFGHLTLYTTNQKIPPVFEVGRSQAMRGIQQGILQILRRGTGLEQMGERHCLYSLTRQCLQDDPVERPSTQELHAQLTRLSVHHPKTAADVMQACGSWSLSKFEMMMTEFKQLRKCLQATVSQQFQSQIGILQAEIEARGQLVDERERDKESKERQIRDLQAELQARGQLLEEREREKLSKDRQIRNLQAEVQARGQLLNQRERDKESKERQIRDLQAELQARGQLLEEREREKLSKDGQIRSLQAEVQARNAEIHQLTQRMQHMESRMQSLHDSQQTELVTDLLSQVQQPQLEKEQLQARQQQQKPQPLPQQPHPPPPQKPHPPPGQLLEVAPQDRQQQQKPHTPPSQKPPTEKPHPPPGQKHPPTKRESVDERSIPQQKKREHQPPQLPAWFNKLNGREAYIGSFLGTTAISDSEANILAGNLRVNKTLETLRFSNVTFSTNGLATVLTAFHDNKSVKTLILGNMTFSDTDSEVLAQVLRINTTIETLGLWNVNVSDVGFTTLAEAMRDNQSLTTLDLPTKTSDSGANALASAIQENKTLQTLGVRFESVSDGGARDFTKKMEGWSSSLKKLVLWGTRNISEEVKKLLRETARRKGINLTLAYF